jgi:hypothetical protein
MERYGVQNGFGAVFTQADIIWKGPNGQWLSVSKYAGNVKKSSIYFSSRSDPMRKENKKGNSSDL